MAGGTDQDVINSMLAAASEIEGLRKANQILEAQMFIVETFARALGFKLQSSGMVEDRAWSLRKHAEAIKQDLDRKPDAKAID